jgi:hypothetical protein
MEHFWTFSWSEGVYCHQRTHVSWAFFFAHVSLSLSYPGVSYDDFAATSLEWQAEELSKLAMPVLWRNFFAFCISCWHLPNSLKGRDPSLSNCRQRIGTPGLSGAPAVWQQQAFVLVCIILFLVILLQKPRGQLLLDGRLLVREARLGVDILEGPRFLTQSPAATGALGRITAASLCSWDMVSLQPNLI